MGGSAPSGGYCRVLLALPVPSLPSPPPSPPSPSGSGVTLIRGDLERRRLWGVRGPGASRGRGGLGAGSPPRRCRGAGSRGSPGPVRLQAVEHRRSGAERHGTARPRRAGTGLGAGSSPREAAGGGWRGGLGLPGSGSAAPEAAARVAWRGVGWGERCRRFSFLCFKVSLVPRAPHSRVVLLHPGARCPTPHPSSSDPVSCRLVRLRGSGSISGGCSVSWGEWQGCVGQWGGAEPRDTGSLCAHRGARK